MKKIVKLEEEGVVIAAEGEENIRARYEWLNFKPEIGDNVEVYEDGEEFIVHKADAKSNVEDKININIVNENTQNQSNTVYAQTGKVINKWLYVLVALFLGGLGIHKFLIGKIGTGVIYLLFCWTYIPAILALITGIRALFKTADANGNIVV